MTKDFKNQLTDIVNRIKDFDAKEIIIFGSHARGLERADSDIDLCIITNKNGKRKIDYIREIRRAIAPILLYPIDILVYDRAEFDERASLNASFEYQIRNEGIKIYGQ